MKTNKTGEFYTLSQYNWFKAFEESSDPIVLIGLDHRIIAANRAFNRIFCREPASAACEPCYNLVHPLTGVPEDCPVIIEIMNDNTSSREIPGRTVGEIFEIITTPVFDKQGVRSASLHMIRDISRRKLNEQLMEANLAIGEFALSHTLEEILVMTIDKAEMLTDSQVGFFHFLEEPAGVVSLKAWSTRTSRQYCTAVKEATHYPVGEAGVWVDCYHQKKPVIHNDYNALLHRKGMPEGHTPVVRELTIPVIRDDKVVAILGVGNKPVDYTETDIEILIQLTNLAYEHVLRKMFEEALHQSEKYAHALLDAIPDLIFRMNRQGIYLDYKGPREVLYHQKSSIIGKNNRDITPPEFAGMLEDKINQTLDTNSMVVFEYQLTAPGMGLRDFEARMVPCGTDEVTAIVRDITERKKGDTALKKKIEELEWLNHMMIDRELRMVELKKEINALLSGSGQEEKYIIHQ